MQWKRFQNLKCNKHLPYIQLTFEIHLLLCCDNFIKSLPHIIVGSNVRHLVQHLLSRNEDQLCKNQSNTLRIQAKINKLTALRWKKKSVSTWKRICIAVQNEVFRMREPANDVNHLLHVLLLRSKQPYRTRNTGKSSEYSFILLKK